MQEASYLSIVFKAGITCRDNTGFPNGISNKDVDNNKICLLRAMSFSILASSLSHLNINLKNIPHKIITCKLLTKEN